MVDQIKYDLIATDKASGPIGKVRKETERLGKQAGMTRREAQALNKEFGGVGRGAGMAGIQVQQFVGQLQGGVSPMIALSQQSADLGFALGVPLLGAFVSIAAVIAGSFIPSLLEAKKTFAELKKEADTVGIGLTQLPLNMTVQNLEALALKAVEPATKLDKLNRRLRELQDELFIAEISGNDFAETEGIVARDAEIVREGIRKLKDEIAIANLELNIANARTQQFADTLFEQYLRAQQAQSAIKNYRLEVKAAQNVDTENNDVLQKKADALRAQLDPMITFNKIANEYQKMNALQMISDKELIEAKQILAKRVLGLKEETKDLNFTMINARATGVTALEDGLVSLVTGTATVKEAFRSMANAVIADLARMSIRQAITIPLAQSMGLSVGERALGGSMTANKPYLVGERGPELVIPRGGSDVVPNNRLSGGSPVNITLNVSTGVSATVRQEMQEMLPRIAEVAKSAVQNAQMRRRM